MSREVTLRQAIARQPQSLSDGISSITATLDQVSLAPLRSGTTVVTGIGASLYAAQAGSAYMRSSGLRAFALPGTALYDGAVDAGDAYIALSASGRSVEPAKAMELRPDAHSYGISGVVNSPLASYVRHMVGTACGDDSGPNTTSYVGTLLALGLMAQRAADRSTFDWSVLPDAATGVLEDVPGKISHASAIFTNRTAIDCVGSGEAFGTAGYTSLLLREAVRSPAQQWDTLNFLHGPMEPNDSGTGVILFGDNREVELASVLAGFGIPALLITSSEGVRDSENLVTIRIPSLGDAMADAILQTIPAQLLTAQLSEDAGLPVCEFRYRQRGTKISPAA